MNPTQNPPGSAVPRTIHVDFPDTRNETPPTGTEQTCQAAATRGAQTQRAPPSAAPSPESQNERPRGFGIDQARHKSSTTRPVGRKQHG